jgi:hypothetical protein
LEIPVFAHVLGHTDIEERIRSAQSTAQRDVQGNFKSSKHCAYIFFLNRFRY